MANLMLGRGSIPGIALQAATAALTLVVVLWLGGVATPPAQAQTLTLLYNFTGPLDGVNPNAGLIRDAAGNLYGTTYYGGSSTYGVVFKVDTKGTETVLHNFSGGADGQYPLAGLIRDSRGNLYGTTHEGGPSGVGSVFKVDTKGTETVLHSFSGSDGCYPYSGLLLDKAGNLYGTTETCGKSSFGTLYRLSKHGTLTVLHNFAGGATDGAYPYFASLLMDMEGNLYGVTAEGGRSNDGVVYKLSKGGTLTVLYGFTGGADGCYPVGTPAMDTTGNLYGTTAECGSFNLGTVWKLSKKRTETVLHSFMGEDGGWPYAGVIVDAKGNLYGDTQGWGRLAYGTVYKLSKNGTVTVLHTFAGPPTDGSNPTGGLVRDGKGNLYSTAGGGSSNRGTVWELTP